MLTENVLILAAGEAGLPMKAPKLFENGPDWLTNSMAVSVVTALLLIGFAQYATRNASLIPGRVQNFWEIIIERLSSVLEGILGWKLLKDTFWFFASIFIFILACNLVALIPGVGTVGWVMVEEGVSPDFFTHHIHIPFLRGANADVNMTMAMAVWFMVLWCFWALKYNGPGGVLKHIFGAPGKTAGFIGLVLVPLFFLVGLIEVISIMVRPIALTFRLYGNIYAGEAMIHSVDAMSGKFAFLALIPVYAFELLVAVVQALVFCLLTAAFTALMCRHDESHEDHGPEGDAVKAGH